MTLLDRKPSPSYTHDVKEENVRRKHIPARLTQREYERAVRMAHDLGISASSLFRLMLNEKYDAKYGVEVPKEKNPA